jgi:tRNA-dihydrouridine synthase B
MMPLNFKESGAVIYAPMAGISDSPSRRIARRFGADITVSELVSSEGVVRNSEKTIDLARFSKEERPFGIQIFGAVPESMASAARILAALGPDFIDINFGCPVRKVVGKNGGSSILKDLRLMERIVTAVVRAVDIPVTVKIRSGWQEDRPVYIEAGKAAQDSGAHAVALHPRFRTQGFDGRADWSHIAALKQVLKIPVIGNGDIICPEDAKRMFDQTGCDAIMVGRGSIGNPWLFENIRSFIKTGTYPPDPGPRGRIELALEHFELNIEHYGLPAAVYRMRSGFCRYIKGLPGASGIRSKIIRLESPSEIRDLLYRYLEDLEGRFETCEAGTAADVSR